MTTKSSSSSSSSSPPTPTPPPSSSSKHGDTYRTMIAGALSGSLARIVSHPLDTIKSQMQVDSVKSVASAASRGTLPNNTLPTAVMSSASSSGHSHGVASSIKRIIANGGMRGFYAGFGASFFGAAPATCLYFTAYDWFKRHSPLSSSHPIAGELTSGFLAETLSCILWVPIDVVKERLQVQSLLLQSLNNTSTAATTTATPSPLSAARPTETPKGLIYRGNVHAIVTIARNEGLRGIYRGYGATLLSYGPFSALYLSGADQLEQMVRRHKRLNATEELPIWAHLGCGTIASSTAAYITTPLDLAKLRIQVQRGQLGFSFGYASLLDALNKIWRNEGITGLWRGSGARVASMAPMCALTWSLNGMFKEKLQHINL